MHSYYSTHTLSYLPPILSVLTALYSSQMHDFQFCLVTHLVTIFVVIELVFFTTPSWGHTMQVMTLPLSACISRQQSSSVRKGLLNSPPTHALLLKDPSLGRPVALTHSCWEFLTAVAVWFPEDGISRPCKVFH